MGADDNASSVQGVRMRITPLNVDGTVTDYPDPRVLTTKGFIRATFSAEYRDGDEIEEPAANGELCITWKGDDSLKRINYSLAVCSPDPETATLLTGGTILFDDENAVKGYASPKVGEAANSPVAIEIWSYANVDGKPAAGLPYWYWIYPYVKLRYDGDREFANGALANEFSGWGVGNDAFQNEDWVYGELDSPWAYVRVGESDLPALGWTGTAPTPGS